MRSLPLKLEPGSDLRLTIEQLGRDQNSSGFVLGVVGNLSSAAFQCPGRSEPTVLEGNLEIITLNGFFTPVNVHLHLSLSDADCQVWGGHLEPGTIVLKGADILVGLIDEDLQNHPRSKKSVNSLKPRIEVFVLPGCPWSARAIRLLKSLDLSHNVQEIDSELAFEKFSQRSKSSTFPQIFIDGDLIGGYSELAELHQSGKLKNID